MRLAVTRSRRACLRKRRYLAPVTLGVTLQGASSDLVLIAASRNVTAGGRISEVADQRFGAGKRSATRRIEADDVGSERGEPNAILAYSAAPRVMLAIRGGSPVSDVRSGALTTSNSYPMPS